MAYSGAGRWLYMTTMLGLSALLGGCRHTTVEGTVSPGSEVRSSEYRSTSYSFAIDAIHGDDSLGPKSVTVKDGYDDWFCLKPKESIDALVGPGSRVEIIIPENKVEEQNYTVQATHIKALD